MFRLVLLFVVVPVVEFTLLIKLGKLVGLWPTLLLVVFTGVVGSALARHQGLSTWRRFNQRLASGAMPGQELVDGIIILLAGALLITPGILTDVVGICGLVPITRRVFRRYIVSRLNANMSRHGARVTFFGTDPGAPATPPDRSETRDDGEEAEAWGGTARPRPEHASGRGDDSDA